MSIKIKVSSKIWVRGENIFVGNNSRLMSLPLLILWLININQVVFFYSLEFQLQISIHQLFFDIHKLFYVLDLNLVNFILCFLFRFFVLLKINQPWVCLRNVIGPKNVLRFSADGTHNLEIFPKLDHTWLTKSMAAGFKHFWHTFFFFKFWIANFTIHNY